MAHTPVTQEDLDRHLSSIDERIAHSTERSDIKFNAIIDKIDTMTNQTAKVLDVVVNDVSKLKQNQATNNAYWKIAGAVLSVLLVAVVGLGFDRLTTSPQHNQPQPQAAQAGIRL
jgi:predicted Zn-dependent protease